MKGNHLLTSAYINNGIVKHRSNSFLEKIVGLLFRRLDFDAESLATLQKYSDKGRVVYISYQSFNTSLLILLNLLRRHDFKLPQLALDYTPCFYQLFSNALMAVERFFRKIFLKNKIQYTPDFEFIKEQLIDDESIALALLSRKIFIRRYLDVKSDSLQHLIETQRFMEDPIYIFPQILFWNQNPERAKNLITTRATGDRSFLSALFIILKSTTPAFMRISEPINLKEEIGQSKTDDAKQIARNIRNKLLEIYNQEKRTVLGPVIKSQQEMMEKVLYHKNVMDDIDELIKGGKGSEKKLRKKAFRYYKEIAADFSIVYLKWFHKACRYMFRKIFDGISYNIDELKKIREASQYGPLIIVPSHKSHMDYLIISSIFYENKIVPPHIVAGSNLTFFPMGKIFRKSGAFFMRRSFKDLQLYPVIFKQYIKTLINEGYSIEFFIEGGRTRTGKLVLPKMGILKYLIDSINEGYNRDMIFVPATISYERILEESSYHMELKGKEKKKETTSAFMKSRKLLRRKYGKVYLSFGEPVSFKQLCDDIGEADDVTTPISHYLIKKIYEITMVTPFALSSYAILLTSAKGFSREMLKNKVDILYDYLLYAGAKMTESLSDKSNFSEIIEYVIESYEEDNIINRLELESNNDGGEIVLEGLYVMNEDERARINFYKNTVMHFFLPVSFVSLSIMRHGEGKDIRISSIYKDFNDLKEIMTGEFIYNDQMQNTEGIVDWTIDYLERRSVIARSDSKLEMQRDGTDELIMYAKMVQDLLESYFIVADAVNQIRRRINRKDLRHEVRKNGIKLYHIGEVKLTESLSMPVYDNAIQKYDESDILEFIRVGKKNIEVDITDKTKAQAFKAMLADFLKNIQ